jgi:hypothetical protein
MANISWAFSTARRRLAGLVSPPWWRSGVSRDRLPQDGVVQQQVRHELLRPGVLLLQSLQALRLVRPKAAILLPPSVVGVVANPQAPANLANRLPTCPAF